MINMNQSQMYNLLRMITLFCAKNKTNFLNNLQSGIIFKEAGFNFLFVSNKVYMLLILSTNKLIKMKQQIKFEFIGNL